MFKKLVSVRVLYLEVSLSGKMSLKSDNGSTEPVRLNVLVFLDSVGVRSKYFSSTHIYLIDLVPEPVLNK